MIAALFSSDPVTQAAVFIGLVYVGICGGLAVRAIVGIRKDAR